MSWSKYQEAVFDFVENGDGNGIVEAMPGSGKSTVIEECVKRLPRDKSILVVAFNRHIRDELTERLGTLAEVHTVNSFGHKVVRAGCGFQKFNKNKLDNILKFGIFKMEKYEKEKYAIFAQCRGYVERMVGLWKANMAFDVGVARMMDFGIDPPEIKGWDAFEVALMAFQMDLDMDKVINYDDQIFKPVRLGLKIPQYDYVFVDEAQDLSPVQIVFTRRAIGGRGLYVGDRRQAIYQFRGADSKAMDNIQMELDARVLPLSICYRCAKRIVAEAATVVPTIEAFEGSPEGTVDTVDDLIAKSGDVVLCRTTAPLVTECLKFIRDGQKATVKGKDVGADLESLIKKLSGDRNLNLQTFMPILGKWYSESCAKAEKMGRETSVYEDTYDTVLALCEHADDVKGLYDAIARIFTDNEEDGIRLMTIHRAKGLEAPRVFILRPEQLPHKSAKTPEELLAEENLKFVAITRAQRELYWVRTKKK